MLSTCSCCRDRPHSCAAPTTGAHHTVSPGRSAKVTPIPGSPGPTWMNIPRAPHWALVRLRSRPRAHIFEAHHGPSTAVGQDAGQGRCRLTRAGLTAGALRGQTFSAEVQVKVRRAPRGLLSPAGSERTIHSPGRLERSPLRGSRGCLQRHAFPSRRNPPRGSRLTLPLLWPMERCLHT